MKSRKIAVLLTCFNRREKTLACLQSFFEANKPVEYTFDVYLVDDGSTDGTSEAVNENYPDVEVIKGNGNLFWAGGMRLAWKTALECKNYDAFLLLNDDVVLFNDFIDNLLKAEDYSLFKNKKTGLYSGSTIDNRTNKTTYGGYKIKTNHLIVRNELLSPTDMPQKCELANANILWVSKEAVNAIGIFDERYTHGIADFDYSMQAVKKGIPVYLAPEFGGVCLHDHGKPWRPSYAPLKDRVAYLKSPKGLAYKEYLYYIKKHFPMFLPYSFVMLWLKTFIPSFWHNYKK
ncbi:MAG: glycosyltransferase family 2 protein [Bacteroidales bacterium]|nr:glycosyltransferase family 2 protein [Bacteroidales bacterium]